MDLQQLADLGQFVSGVVVIISLVYLAVQVRQNTRTLRTDNYARALDRVSAIQSQLGRDAELAALFSRGAADIASLSPLQRVQFMWFAYEMLGAFEFMFHQARERAIPDEVWDRWSAAADWWLSFPGLRAGAPDPAAARRTQEFIRGTAS